MGPATVPAATEGFDGAAAGACNGPGPAGLGWAAAQIDDTSREKAAARHGQRREPGCMGMRE